MSEKKERTVSDVVAEAAVLPNTEYQFIHECVCRATRVKAKKGADAYTQVTIATRRYSPGDAFQPSKAEFVGILLWIPMEDYKRLALIRKEGK